MNNKIGKYMDSNNVILFPKTNMSDSQAVRYSFEEIDRNVEMMKHYHIQETIANLAPLIFNNLEVAGFNLIEETEDDDGDVIDLKDGALVIEALRSLMCKHYDIFHPFQIITENVFLPDDEEIGALKIADSISVSLKRNDVEETE